MIPAFRPRPFRSRALVLTLGLIATLPSLHAHRPSEITSVGRLQHGRLEFTVTLSLVMANFLLRDPAAPEAPPVDAENFGAHREALLRLAPAFYTIQSGSEALRPEKILVALNPSGEPEFHFVYPLPAAGPLRIRAPGLQAPGTEGSHLVRVFDDDENLLGAGLLGPAPAMPELSIPLSAAPAVSTP